MKSFITLLIALVALLFPATVSHPAVEAPKQVAAVGAAVPLLPKIAVSFENSDATIAPIPPPSFPIASAGPAPSHVARASSSASSPASAAPAEKASPLPTAAAPARYVTQDALAAQLNTLANSFRQEFYGAINSIPSNYASGGIQSQIALAQRIDTLSNVTFSNATVHGLSGLTATDIPALNYFAATNAVSPGTGGTGTTTAPSYGQLLVGNAAGGYDFLATSSLGISGTWGGIGGTLSSQSDLQSALNAKLSLSAWYATTTDALHEGSNNLYFTNNRVASVIAGTTTDALAQGSINKYYSTNLFAVSLAGTSTDALPQGTTNRYYSDALVGSFIAASTTIPKTYTANVFTGGNVFNGSVTLGALNGPLQAINGVVSATSTLSPAYGGTGIGNPSAAGLLLGSYAGGSWQQLATSSLGLLTTNVVEGSNLYFTAARADARINATSSIGTLTGAPNLGTLATSLTGFLKATAGVLSTALVDLTNSVTGILPVGNGGTGSTTLFGILKGNGTSQIATAIAGSDYAIPSQIQTFKDWQIANGYIAPTTTLGVIVNASSTIGDGTQSGGLTISGGATTTGTAYFAGNVGIGTTSPATKLEVDGGLRLEDLGAAQGLSFTTNSTNKGFLAVAQGAGQFAVGTVAGDLVLRTSGGKLLFDTNNGASTPSLTILGANGNVGIGTTTPNWKLEVAGTRPSIALSDTGAADTNKKHWLLTSEGGNLYIGTTTDAYATSTPAALTITNGGNVGIGTTSPISNLSIQYANSSITAPALTIDSTGNQSLLDFRTGDTQRGLIRADSSGNLILDHGVGGTLYLGYSDLTSSRKIDFGGVANVNITNGNALTVVAGVVFSTAIGASAGTNFLCFDSASGAVHYANGCTASDERLKTNIRTLSGDSGLAAIEELHPVSFDWLDSHYGTSTQVGLIAQEVQQVFPSLVAVNATTTITLANGDRQEIPNTLSLNYEGLVSPLVKAVQEIAALSDTFKQTVIAWLADATNGITNFFAGNIHAQNELCVGSTCVTPAQFQAIVAAAGQSPSASPSSSAGSAASTTASSTPDNPPVIQIIGNNPATIHVGDSYADLGATITAPEADKNLGIKTFLNGKLVSDIVIDTSAPTTDTIDYVATDGFGSTATSTRLVIVEAASSTVVQ